MKRKKRPIAHCVIVNSERDPGLVSIRSAVGGKGGTFKRALTDAGFKPGDFVTISLYRGKDQS